LNPEGTLESFQQSMLFIGKQVKELRLRAGLTIEKAAEELNISFPIYLYLEKGSRHTPTLETLYKLAKFYEVPLGYFFQNNSPPVRKSAERQKLLREFDRLSREHKAICVQMLTFLNNNKLRKIKRQL
jgi:transcriptional regulator with XRE-family HTH domain